MRIFVFVSGLLEIINQIRIHLPSHLLVSAYTYVRRKQLRTLTDYVQIFYILRVSFHQYYHLLFCILNFYSNIERLFRRML